MSVIFVCLLDNQIVSENVNRDGIQPYYDDLDFKNILDYVQEKVVYQLYYWNISELYTR